MPFRMQSLNISSYLCAYMCVCVRVCVFACECVRVCEHVGMCVFACVRVVCDFLCVSV
jgi:hypothetical protein